VAKVTSKLQVTIPKVIADRYEIRPGDEVEWVPAADAIRVVPAKTIRKDAGTNARLRLFDAAVERQRARERAHPEPSRADQERGWSREELYERGSAR
jgi:AbrB family looped-hinge helix DNA binding protein